MKIKFKQKKQKTIFYNLFVMFEQTIDSLVQMSDQKILLTEKALKIKEFIEIEVEWSVFESRGHTSKRIMAHDFRDLNNNFVFKSKAVKNRTKGHIL